MSVTEADRTQILAACERLSLDYSHYADLGQMEDFAALFAEDAELVVAGASTKGRAAILKSVTSNPARGQAQSIHAISNLRLDVTSPTEAKGAVCITAYFAPKKDGVGVVAEITPAAVGEYLDVYRKTAEGWRFARREFVPSVTAAV